MKNKRIVKIIFIVMMIALLLGVIGISYAYFTMNIVQNQKLTVLNSGDLKLRYTDNTELSLENALPGDSIVKTFTVENIGSKKVSYNIIWNNLINTINNYDLQLDMKCKSYKDYNTSSKTESGKCSSFYKAVPYTETSISKDIKRNNEIDTGITHEYTVTITFKNRPYLQNDNLNKSFSGKIDLEEYVDPSPEATYCTYDGELKQGAEYVNGQYTYRYKQEGYYASSGLGWNGIYNVDGWGVQLTDKTSTNSVSSKLCTYINDKPVVSMAMMFYDSQATEIDLSSFNTSNVMNMQGLFLASKASSLDLSSFNTSNVTNMRQMFQSLSVNSLDLSTFDTSKVTDMLQMFYECEAILLDLSSFDTSNVEDMGSMFNSSQATKIDLSSFNTSKLTNIAGMFRYSNAILLDLSNFNTSKVDFMGEVFESSKATIIDVSNFDTSNVTYMNNMFSSSQATTLDVSSFDTSKVTDMSFMFYQSQATTLDVSNFDTSKVTNMSWMFAWSKTTVLDVSNFDTSNVTSMYGMFSGSQATTLDLNNFDTSNVTNMSGMFSNSKAVTLDVSNFNTSNVTNMSSMFYKAQVSELDLSNFDTSNVTDMGRMFYYSTNLKTIYVSNKFNTVKVTNGTNMFTNCPNLVGGADTKYDANHVDKEYARIDGGTSNPGYFTSKL